MKMIPPDSKGGASAPNESPSSNSSAALAPAALSTSPAMTSDQVSSHFAHLHRLLINTREAIERELTALAPRCPNADTFISGCNDLGREASALNSHLINVQVAIRLGAKI